jgi:hypothetical protein
MDIVHTVLYLLHIVGLAGLIAAMVLALLDKTGAKAAAFHSGLLQLVTGLALVGINYARLENYAPDNTKLGVKLLIMLAVVGMAIAGKRQVGINKPLYVGIGLLSITNAAIAWLWRG